MTVEKYFAYINQYQVYYNFTQCQANQTQISIFPNPTPFQIHHHNPKIITIPLLFLSKTPNLYPLINTQTQCNKTYSSKTTMHTFPNSNKTQVLILLIYLCIVIQYTKRIHELQQKQQILKYSLADHQEQVKKLYMNLYQNKKILLQSVTSAYNSNNNMEVDIGILQQFTQMKKIIQKQNNKITKLKSDLQMQSISGLNNQRNIIMLRQKRQQIQNQIQSGRRFAASQYVRDYLERTHVHKVSYQDVKYQYQIKNKLKEYLKNQKQIYQKKKEEIKKAIEVEGLVKKQLESQKARLESLGNMKMVNSANGMK